MNALCLLIDSYLSVGFLAPRTKAFLPFVGAANEDNLMLQIASACADLPPFLAQILLVSLLWLL